MLRRGDNMVKKVTKYKMSYYLPNQSKLFCPPYFFETYNKDELKQAVNIAMEKGYKIVKVEKYINNVYVPDK